uniref:CRIM domain-containing protein n=3 Tax=Mesocestoides corti TaxID=53468 RepID=A0A5K3FIP5_MESCO
MDDFIQELRHTFIISDDTSTCENLCRDYDEFLAQIAKEDETSSNPCRYSPEIIFTPNLESSRWNYLSEQRRQLALVSNNGICPCYPEGVAGSIPALANAEPLPPPPPVDKSKKSALTIALEKSLLSGKSANANKFIDYAVFDGRSADGKSASIPATRSSPRLRSFLIWFWRVPGLPKVSISVLPSASCTVKELVGLSLWQYFNENPSAAASFNNESCHLDKDAASLVNRIAVYIFDMHDDVEDFPPLQASDIIHKYEFDALALVENVAIAPPNKEMNAVPLVFVTVHLAQGISLVRFPVSATLETVLNEAINRRKLRQHEGYAYHLERWVDPELQQQSEDQQSARKPLDPSLTLADCQKDNMPLRFVLIREHSRYDPVVDDSDPGSSPPALPTPAAMATKHLQSRKYRATQLRGPSSRDVQLTISRDRLDVQASRLPKIFRGSSKSLTVPMSHVVDCSLCATTSGDVCDVPLSKVQFTITYLPSVVSQQAATTTCASSAGRSSASQIDDDDDNVAGAEKALEARSGVVCEDTKSLVFETQWTSARAICHQLNLIFSCCPSRIRDAYTNSRIAPL